MSSITQNFESNNKLLSVSSGNSLDSKFVDGLWEEKKNIYVTDVISDFNNIYHMHQWYIPSQAQLGKLGSLHSI